MAETGKVIWITGASSGIGRALALRLARDGHRIAVSARSRDALEELSAEASGEGSIHPWPLDVTDGNAVAAAVEAIERDLGPIDIAVLAAGTHQPVSA